MKIMILVSLEMIFPSTMRSCRTDQKVNSIPHECKWCCVHKEGRSQAAEIVEMFHWVHGQSCNRTDVKGREILDSNTCKRFNVSVPMMKTVNVFVHG